MRSAYVSSTVVIVGVGAFVALGALSSCSGDDGGSAADDADSGTDASTGGATQAGGATASGGASATGGMTATGGVTATDGATTGGATATDGAPGDATAAVDPVLAVDLTFTSLLPSEQEFIVLSALDGQGAADTVTVTSSNDAVATATIVDDMLVIQAGTTLGEATITVTSGSNLTQTVNALVSDPRALKIGNDLLIAFVDEFDLLYWDMGSGANLDGSFWSPRVRNDFFAVGHLGRGGYGDPTGQVAMIVVKALTPDALALPVGYNRIWDDTNSGASMNGAFWSPVCPANYEALGSVGSVNSHAMPALDAIRCVRSDLAEIGAIGGQVWNDGGSGASDDFSSWSVVVPPNVNSEGTMPLAAGTFVGVGGYGAPTSDPTANILRIGIPIVRDVNLDVEFPTLTSLQPPPETTPIQIGRSILIPFTGISDPARTLDYQVDTSPFYRLDRDVYYRRLIHQYNQTTVEQPVSHTVTTGVTSEQSQTFSSTTGIEVSVEAGVTFSVFSASTTVTVSQELGYSTSTTIGEFTEESVTKDVVVPPNSAAALWQLIHRFTLKRRNGNAWETVGTPWEVGVNSFVVDQYPD